MSGPDRARFPCSFAHCQREGGLDRFHALSSGIIVIGKIDSDVEVLNVAGWGLIWIDKSRPTKVL